MLTRFYDRVTGGDGPVSGAIMVIPVLFDTALVTNSTFTRQIHLPAGMSFKVTDVRVFCGTVTSDPAITIGTSAAGTQIVASANLATGAQSLTVKSYTPAATGMIDVRIVTDTGDAIALPVSINVVGHVLSPPTSMV